MSRQYSNRSYNSFHDNSSRRFHQSTPDDISYFQQSSHREGNHRRPTVPLNRIPTAATVSASTPHYRFENPSAASFTRRPPWFDGDWEDQQRTTYHQNHHHHTKRQRSSVMNTSNSQPHHRQYERKRSRHNEHEHYSSYSNHQSTTNPMLAHNRSAQPHHQPSPPLPTIYRQSMPSSSSSSNMHYHQNGITFESPAYHSSPIHYQTSMSTHIHPRPSSSFLLTNLLHRIIHTHAASYSDNHIHHHPPAASIDLIAYAWISPSHEIFSLPTTFNMQFGDFFDLTIPDETPVVGLTDAEFERLPTINYSKTNTNIDIDEKCAICLNEYNNDEKLKYLRCKHYFHSECIEPWLKTSIRCPVCRREQTN